MMKAKTALLLVVALLPIWAAAQTPSSTSLGASPNPSTFGQAVTLTATVTPGTATGKVTIYDGALVLGIGTLSGGQAMLTTRLLASGSHSLKAYYTGDATFAVSLSAPVTQAVTGLSQNGFQAAVNYNIGTFPYSVAMGDFNGDGRADLAVANANSNNVSVLLGNGNGTIQTAVNYNTGTGSRSVALGDFNGDGKTDLAVANEGSNNVSILIGNGDGTFQAAANFGAGTNPWFVAAGDFNADGKADLAVANFIGDTVRIFLGNGNGTFQTGVPYSAGTRPISIAVADFNGDGKADLAIGGDFGSMVILLGVGDGTFQFSAGYNTGFGSTVAAKDLNRDGKTDLAVASLGNNNVSVLLGNGDGTFQSAATYSAGSTPGSVAVGDFNGDGRADLAVGNSSPPSVSVLLGNGNGTFQAPVSYGAGGQPGSIAVGDFNGDGRSDLAVANNTSNNVSILLGVAVYQNVKLFVVATTGINAVYRYDVPITGSPTLDTTLTDASFNNPAGVAFSPASELFVVNRFTTDGSTGSVSRFLDPHTTLTPHGTITTGLANPHWAAFRNGELFVANYTTNSVPRFLFDAGGNAVSNGAIAAAPAFPKVRGVAVAPWGELFISQDNISRYVFDSSGVATANGTITGNGLNTPLGLIFSPRGELFVASYAGNSISRFTFDSAHNVTANGQITGGSLATPVDVTFSPWGELFVSIDTAAQVSRFTFDGSFNAVANGTFSTPTIVGGLGFAPEAAALPDLALTNAGTPEPVTVGSNLTYNITVTNVGSSLATGVSVSDTLPASTTFVSATPSQGSCSGTSTVSCSLGPLNSGATATVSIVVTPTITGPLSNTASVTGTETEPILANNSATANNTVNALPCTSTFTNGGGGGLWTTDANWSPSGVPGSAANVCINSGSTVTLSSGAQTVNSVNSGGVLNISGGSLTLASASMASNLTLSGGTLTGAGTLTLNGTFSWTGGIMSGSGSTTVASGTAFTIAPGASKTLDARTLNNATSATILVTNPGNIFVQNSAVINNQAGAVLDLQGQMGFTCSIGCVSPSINNAGTLRRSGTFTGTTAITSVNFTNTGTVDVQIGTLNIGGLGSVTDTGSFAIAVGTTLGFTAGTHTLTSAATVTGTGTISVSGATVNYNSTATLTQPLLVSAGTLTVNSTVSTPSIAMNFGGVLNLNNTSNVSTSLMLNGDNLTFGTLGGTGALTVNGAFSWESGTMSGSGSTTVASGTLFTISGSPKTLDTRTLNNAASATMTAQNRISLQNNAIFNNQAGAVFDLRSIDLGSNNPIITCSSGCVASAINNAGTFRKSTQTGPASITSINFTNTGTVDVQIGTLNIGGPGSVTDTGSFVIAAGSTLAFTAGTRTLTAAATVTGTGTFSVAFPGATVNYNPATLTQTLQVSAGTLNVNTAVSLSSVSVFGGTLNLPNTTNVSTLLNLVGGTLTGAAALTLNGTFNWSGGTMSGSGSTTVPSGTTFTIDGTKFLDTRTLNNAASATATFGSIYLNNSAIFNNQAGAVLDAPDFNCNTGCTASAFNNAGTFRGSNISSINFTNTGTVDVQVGTLSIGGLGSVTHTGSFALASGTTLLFGAGTHTLTAAATITGPGTISVNGGTVNYNTAAALTQPLEVHGGTMNVNTTVSTPSILSSGTVLNLANTSNVTSLTLDFGTLTGAGALTVTGTFNWIEGTMSGSGSTTVSSGAVFTISGTVAKTLDTRTLNNATSATVTGTGSIFLQNSATFNNQAGAVFDIQSNKTFTCSIGCVSPAINNAGTFRKSTTAGTTNITSINFTNTGTVDLKIGTLRFANGYTQTAGSTVLNGGNLTIVSGTANLNGGLLSGTGTVTGNVSNAAMVGPGLSPGTITITGNYTQTSLGTLLIELGGTAPGTFDRLLVSGTATLAGTLALAYTGGFTAGPADTFTILTAATRTGTFGTVSGLSQAATYNATSVVLSSGVTPTTTTLGASPNPSVFGAPVTLTATVSSAAATGRVTFYDGVTVLGTGTLSVGQAMLITRLLPSGIRSLKAYYAGDASFAGSTSTTVSQTVTALPQNGFQTAVNYNTGTTSQHVGVGDFNGDGKADLAVANYGVSGTGTTMSVLLGNGDGTFQAAVDYNVGIGPHSVAVGDFNRDGKADLVVANQLGNNVSVLLGNGDGTFLPAVNYNTGNNPLSIAVGDFNGDGKADLAVANYSSNAVSVLLGNGDGTFQGAVNYNAGTNPNDVAVGDFNGDGKADLTVVNYIGANVSVLLGNGDGTFQAAVNYTAGSQPISVAVGDFNADGKADLAVPNSGSNNASVLLGNGDGTFLPAVNYSAGSLPAYVAVGDFNGDGKADLAVANYAGANVSVLLGNGNGTFQAAVNYNAGTNPASVAVGDFNGDGRTDLAVANSTSNNVSILLGTVVVADYLVGDSYPSTGYAAGQFGNSTLDNFDLIAALRAVTLLPGAVPPACSDRYDAMDSFPADGAARGGNGLLDNFDLIALLRRVTSLDTTRPMRVSRGLSCPDAPPEVVMSRKPPPGMTLGARARRVPVYYTAPADQDLHGLSFSVGAGTARLRFVPGELGSPTLLDNALPGLLAVAWLDDLHVAKGQRILLGYVEMPVAATLEVFGIDVGAAKP